MANNANCPDRTREYLLNLQTKYREDDIPLTKFVVATATEIVTSNPFRVFLSFAVLPTGQVDIYFVNESGQLVWYAGGTTAFNVTVTQQLHFYLPTFKWVGIAANADAFIGAAVVKT
jgi:hypothetical protein